MPDFAWMDDPDTYADGPEPGCLCADCADEAEFAALVAQLPDLQGMSR